MPKVKQSKSNKEIEDCWNQIGVWGNQNQVCEKLDDVVHCHNCGVFIRAGRRLLDREAPAEYQEEWRKLLVKDRQGEKKNKAVVVFRLGNEWFGLAAGLFQEVIQACNVHRIPHNNNPVLKGIVSIRGELHLCISLGQILGLEKAECKKEGTKKGVYERMVVVEREDCRYVFAVSEIRDIHHYADSELAPPPTTAKNDKTSLLKGVVKWKEQYVSCFDDSALLAAIDGSII